MTMLSLVLQINAVTAAEVNQTAVEHPLLSQVRACSTTPEAAVSFFTAILHPKPSARLTSVQALDHPYIRQCVHQMQDHYHPPPLDPPRSWEERLRQDRFEESAGQSRMLRSLGILGKAAGLAGSAVVKSVATAVTGKRQHDMSQYFPEYTHPERDSELLTNDPEDRLTAVIRDLGLSVNPQQSSAGTSDAGLGKVPQPISAQPQADPLLQGNASAAAVGINPQLLAAACFAVNGQRPALVAKSQVRMPALKANKGVFFDPLHRPGARLQRHPHHNFSARTGRSAPSADSGIQQAPDAAVAYAAAGSSAAAATEAQGAVDAGHAETQLPIIAGSSAETAKTAVSDSTGVTTPSEVCASTATAPSSLPAASAGGQTEPVSVEQMSLPAAQGTGHDIGGQSGTESFQQGYAATADSGCSSAVVASGDAGAESTRQVTPGTAAAANTASNATAAQHTSASAAASVNRAASVSGAASDSVKSHKTELLPMAAEVSGLTLAQQKLRSHQIELLPEDEEDFYPVPQQLPPHLMPPLENVGESVQTQSQIQPEGVQHQAVSSLYSATEQDSDMADVSSQQVSVATAGNLVAGGTLSGPFTSSEGSPGPFAMSGEGEIDVDMEDDAHRQAGSNAPALYVEDMPIARYRSASGTGNVQC